MNAIARSPARRVALCALLFIGSLMSAATARADTPYVQQAKLQASDAANNDSFGDPIVVSADGSTAIIGAHFVGAAYVFVRTGGTWIQQAKLVSSDGGAGFFGNGIALSADGNTVIIGAFSVTGGGGAYVFTRTGTAWSERQKLSRDPATTDGGFGGTIAISRDGSTALVATDFKVYAFTRVGGIWTQQQRFAVGGGTLVNRIAMSASGDMAALGTPFVAVGGTYNQGAISIIVRSGGLWSEQTQITANDGQAGSALGANAVSLSDDGATLATTGGNAIYLFTGSGGTWTQSAELTRPGISQTTAALTADGNTLFVGTNDPNAPPRSQVYILARNGNAWATQGQFGVTDDTIGSFGYPIATTGDGRTVIVGAGGKYLFGNPGFTTSGPGSAFVFTPYIAPLPPLRPTGSPANPPPNPAPSPRSGAPPGPSGSQPTPAPLPVPRS